MYNKISESLTTRPFGKIERDFIFNTLDPNSENIHELTPYLDKSSRSVLLRRKPFTVSFDFKTIKDIYPTDTISNAMLYLTNSYTVPVILRVTFTDTTGKIITPINFGAQDPSITDAFFDTNKVFAMRLISSGLTLYNNTPKMYVSGTILASQYYSLTQTLNNFQTEIVPLTPTDITSMSGYKQFDAADGIYCVSQQVAPINNYIDVSGNTNGLYTISAFGEAASSGAAKNLIYPLNEKPTATNPISYRRCSDIACRTNTAISIPLDVTYGVWSMKIVQNTEYLLHANSPLAPSIVPNVPHDNLPLLFCQEFNVIHNGIYPSYYNDQGKLTELIVKAFVTLLPIILPYLLKQLPKGLAAVMEQLVNVHKPVNLPKRQIGVPKKN